MHALDIMHVHGIIMRHHHACLEQAYLSCVIHRYSEAPIGKRLDSCVARLGARVDVELKPVCKRGRWRRWHGGVDSEWRFRSLYVKGLSVLIRIVLRRYLPLKLCLAHCEMEPCVSASPKLASSPIK